MTTPTEHQQLNAFVDGELDLKSQLEIEQRLADDPALRGQVKEMRQLGELVREQATYHPAPEALRHRITTLLTPAQVATAVRKPPMAEAPKRWLGWRPLAASLSFATVLAVALNLA